MDFTKPIFGQKKLILSGHRGDRTGEDENTMAAFRRAVDCGCDMIETDLRRTKDNQIVLRHDAVIEGIGEVRDHTCEELLRVKPDLPLLSDLAAFAADRPELGLMIELKDAPVSFLSGGIGQTANHPAPYSGNVPVCSGHVFGPEDGQEPVSEDALRVPGEAVPGFDDVAFAMESAEMAAEILLEYGLGNRVWILAFSGQVLEHVYRKYGSRFHYHAFYPWFIMGDMTVDPASFCELACMQHRYLSRDKKVIRYRDPLCPESWWKDVLGMGMVPIGAPSLATMENFEEALRRGCGLINANDPVAIGKRFL